MLCGAVHAERDTRHPRVLMLLPTLSMVYSASRSRMNRLPQLSRDRASRSRRFLQIAESAGSSVLREAVSTTWQYAVVSAMRDIGTGSTLGHDQRALLMSCFHDEALTVAITLRDRKILSHTHSSERRERLRTTCLRQALVALDDRLTTLPTGHSRHFPKTLKNHIVASSNPPCPNSKKPIHHSKKHQKVLIIDQQPSMPTTTHPQLSCELHRRVLSSRHEESPPIMARQCTVSGRPPHGPPVAGALAGRLPVRPCSRLYIWVCFEHDYMSSF